MGLLIIDGAGKSVNRFVVYCSFQAVRHINIFFSNFPIFLSYIYLFYDPFSLMFYCKWELVFCSPFFLFSFFFNSCFSIVWLARKLRERER